MAERPRLGAYGRKTGVATFFVHYRAPGRQREMTPVRVNGLLIRDGQAEAVTIMRAASRGRDGED